jgi:hypothetical protein
MKILITKFGVPIELKRVSDWHLNFSWRNWRIGVHFESSMWEFDFLWFQVWCERYHKHGDQLSEIPKDADVIIDFRPVSEFNEFP